jgi:hypothetical protein
MRPFGMVVILDELAEEPFEMLLAERDNVVEQLSPERPDEPLDVRILPRAAIGRPDLLDAATAQERRDTQTVDAVVVPVPGALAPDVGPALRRRA